MPKPILDYDSIDFKVLSELKDIDFNDKSVIDLLSKIREKNDDKLDLVQRILKVYYKSDLNIKEKETVSNKDFSKIVFMNYMGDHKKERQHKKIKLSHERAY